MSDDPEYRHVVDQIKDDIRAIRTAQEDQARVLDQQASAQQQTAAEITEMRLRLVGNGNPEGSLCWDVAEIKREIAPFDVRGQKKSFRGVVAECHSYVRGFKMTWSKAGGIVLFLMQGVILAYLTGLIPKHP